MLELAGPIEISPAEVALILLVLVAMALAIPTLAGIVAVVMYRRRTPAAARSSREGWLTFFKWFAIALGAQIALAFLIGGIQELIG